MATVSSLASFSFSSPPFIGSKIPTSQPDQYSRRFRLSSSCASTTSEGPTSHNLKPKSLYEVLGIQKGATCQEIKAAYRKLARTLHPDVAAANHQKEETVYEFIKLQEAYETLSDPEKRSDYDRSLFGNGTQESNSRFSVTATTRARSPVAAGFPAYTSRRWETDQCW